MPDTNGKDLLIRNGQVVERGNMQTIEYEDPQPLGKHTLKGGARASHDHVKLPNLFNQDKEMNIKEKQDVSSATSKFVSSSEINPLRLSNN